MDPADEARRRELAKEARRIQEDTEHSGAQHFAAGQRWRGCAFWLGLPTTILVTVASTGAGLGTLATKDFAAPRPNMYDPRRPRVKS